MAKVRNGHFLYSLHRGAHAKINLTHLEREGRPWQYIAILIIFRQKNYRFEKKNYSLLSMSKDKIEQNWNVNFFSRRGQFHLIRGLVALGIYWEWSKYNVIWLSKYERKASSWEQVNLTIESKLLTKILLLFILIPQTSNKQYGPNKFLLNRHVTAKISTTTGKFMDENRKNRRVTKELTFDYTK